jgi:hypothetical protein
MQETSPYFDGFLENISLSGRRLVRGRSEDGGDEKAGVAGAVIIARERVPMHLFVRSQSDQEIVLLFIPALSLTVKKVTKCVFHWRLEKNLTMWLFKRLSSRG